jgi:hypothetical protein
MIYELELRGGARPGTISNARAAFRAYPSDHVELRLER